MFGKLFALGGYSLPYNLSEPYKTSWGAWQHCKGASKDDGTAVSVFRISATSKTDPKLVAARNGVKRLKLLRHPNMLVYKDTAEVEEKGETVIYLITEPVQPLDDALHGLQLGTQRADYLAMGLYHIANAVSFLNNDCNLIHGNVCMGAVVVTETLDWKLHGLDLVSEHQWTGDLPLTNASWLVGNQYKPAEVAKGDWQSIKENPPWAVDAWGLGCLMAEAFHGRPLSRTEDLRDTDCIPAQVLQYYQRLLASLPSRRLNPIKLLESAVFKTKLVETVSFLENLAVKDVVEKETFFKRLPATMPSLPQPVSERKVLPLLASALEFGGAPPVALTTLLQVGAHLSEEDQQRKVLPTLSKLFASNDRTIRKSLLENIDSYGKGLPTALVEEQIYPNLSTGFTDSMALMRELTLKSMIVLAPKLSQRTINQSLLKFLAKLQVDEEPSIRANTTILLGNLAEYLSEATCKRVLLNAFTRALKDPFPPARIAGLKAMAATSKYYNAEETATRVLPSVTPLGIDPVADVRGTALTTIDVFIKMLKDAHNSIAPEGPGAPQHTPAFEAPPQGGQATAAAGAGWGTWAMSSLGLSSAHNSATNLKVMAGPPSPAASPTPPVVNGIAAAGAGDGARPNGTHGVGHDRQTDARPAAAPAQRAPGAGDGWDNDDDLLLDMEDDAAEKAARERLSKLGTGSKSTSQRRPPSGARDGGLGTGGAADGLDSLLAEVSQQSTGSANGGAPRPARARGAGTGVGTRTGSAGTGVGTRTGSAGARKTGTKVIKLGATKAAKTLGDDWGADDF